MTCRDFAYVARDCVTRKHMCHVFRCDGLARHIANALRDICRRILAERAARAAATAATPPAAADSGRAAGAGGGIARPNNLPNLARVGGGEGGPRDNSTGELFTFESIYKSTIIPAVIISASLSISRASVALMVRACRLDHLSVCVCLSGKCIVSKRPIGSGCRLG